MDMSNLEKRAKDTEMLIRSIEQQMSGRSGKMEGQQSDIIHKPADTGYISELFILNIWFLHIDVRPICHVSPVNT
jgi:hypothetical protein